MSQIIRRELATSKTSKKNYEKTMEDKILALQSIVGSMLVQQESLPVSDTKQARDGDSQ